MMTKFTQITDKLPYPNKIKAKLSTIHADIITYAIEHFENTSQYKSKIISVLNTVSFMLISGDSIPRNWSASEPLSNISCIDPNTAEDKLKSLFICSKDIIWDIDVTVHNQQQTKVSDTQFKSTKSILNLPTPKEYLYIRPPTIPQFDISKPWLNTVKNGIEYTIYQTLPAIPHNQSQISVTTDIDLMTDKDLLNLFPNCFIKTRASIMYENYKTLKNNKIGVIFPIGDFSEKQIYDNIIKYPHFYKLKRFVDDKYVSFYSNIEINGILYDTMEIWDSIPDSRYIPKNADYIKEYVVRRYLLERDNGVSHKYPLFGSLNPYLTLFTTIDDYYNLGYTDALDLAKQCVKSRIDYKQSRNPVIRTVYGT